MGNELIPFHMKNKIDIHSNTIHFSLGNIGLQIKIQSGILENCLSIFIIPMALFTQPNSQDSDWIKYTNRLEELVLPLPSDDPLLYYARYPFDHIQWAKDSVKVFWGREVLQVSVKKIEEHYELLFKKLYWDGSSANWRTGVRETYSTNNKEYDYSLNLANALTKEKYLKWIKENNITNKEEHDRLIKRETRKKKVNKVLNSIGLQLKD